MFYCWIHNWYSTDNPCPACYVQKTITATTATSTEPEENKSNDSFQWTDSLVGAYANFVQDNVRPGEAVFHSTMIERFKESKKPKPQAENKADWEIVAYEGKHYQDGGRIIYLKRKDGTFNHGIPMIAEKEMTEDRLIKRGAKIFMVKRLSDGEVFTVGDELGRMEIGENRIDGFLLNYKGNDLWISTNLSMGYGCSFGHAEKLPPQPQKEELQWVAAKQISFNRVLKTLKDNKVMVDTRDDGIYIRLAGNECDGYAFSDKFVNAYPFGKSKSQNSKHKQ